MDFSKIGCSWPDCFSRKKAEELTGGGVDARTLANLDCIKQGPPGKFRLGRKTMYMREPFLKWLRDRMEAV